MSCLKYNVELLDNCKQQYKLLYKYLILLKNNNQQIKLLEKNVDNLMQSMNELTNKISDINVFLFCIFVLQIFILFK
jgi:hypothetical protein